MTNRRSRQSPAGAHFDQDAVRIGKDQIKLVGESDGCSYLPSPDCGVDRLFGRHPGSRDVGKQRHVRLVELYVREKLSKLRDDRIHQIRMESVRCPDSTSEHPLVLKAILKLAYVLLGPGDHAVTGIVHR